MRSHLPAFMRQLAFNRAAIRTVRSYERVVWAFTSFCGNVDPTRTSVEAFLDRPRLDGRQRAPRGRNHELSALRSWFSFLIAKVGWPADPTAGLDWLQEPAHDPVVLSVGEIRRVFATAAEQPDPVQRARNLALLALLSATGLRVHEVVKIDLDQFDPIAGTLYAVKGKGDTQHDQVLNVEAVRLIERWLDARRTRADATERGLFVGLRTGRRLSIRAIQHLVRELGRTAGIRRSVSPHSFRHSVATIALSQGTDIVVVASVLRHAKLETPRNYIRLVDTQRRAAVARLGVVVPHELLEDPASVAENIPPANAGEEDLRAISESHAIRATDSSCVQGRLDAVSTAIAGGERPASVGRSPGASKRQGSLPEPSSMATAVGEKTLPRTALSATEALHNTFVSQNAAVSSSRFDGLLHLGAGTLELRTDRRSTGETTSSLLIVAPFTPGLLPRNSPVLAKAGCPRKCT